MNTNETTQPTQATQTTQSTPPTQAAQASTLKETALGERVGLYCQFVNRVIADQVMRGARNDVTFKDKALDLSLSLAEEAGEVARYFKRLFFRDKRNERENLKEELGDVLFCAIGVAQWSGFTLREVLEANEAKLSQRYAVKASVPQGHATHGFATPTQSTETHQEATIAACNEQPPQTQERVELEANRELLRAYEMTMTQIQAERDEARALVASQAECIARLEAFERLAKSIFAMLHRSKSGDFEAVVALVTAAQNAKELL